MLSENLISWNNYGYEDLDCQRQDLESDIQGNGSHSEPQILLASASSGCED